MTDKDRLGIIKGTPYLISCDVLFKDFKWLIGQAEQVQNLESYMDTLAKYGDSTREKLLGVKEENKKLRAALEAIAVTELQKGMSMLSIARKALEDSK